MTGIIAAAGITAAAGLAGGLLSKGGALGGSGGQPAQYSQANQQYPDWVNNAAQQNYGMATNAAYTLMPPYSGQRVADLTSGQLANINALQGNVGSTNAAYNAAQGATQNLMGYQPQQITPQTLAGTNLSQYMNPYTQSVINPSMQLLGQQNQQGLNQIGANAAGAKAFGGSRQGVAEGAQNAQSNLYAGQLGAQLYGQNFNQAQAAATGDIQRNLAAQTSNTQYGLQGAQLQGNMAAQLGALATQGQNAYITGINAAQQGQNQLYGQSQAQINAQMAQYAQQQQYPLQQLQILQNALQVSPYGQQTTQMSPGPSTNPALSGLGYASTAAGLYGALGINGLWNNPASGNTAANPAAYAGSPGLAGMNSWLTGGLSNG